ncbi:MAG TPA: VWA domain-containing protein [Leucothrix mucor]|uniref:VWA domain-containing protein n=1 Tax=Leucothrix mucor TaxID=45248 RepID=A0A7V2WUV9_LEUMU|nr:VWA domain-containing protein [Leucothrix mucor]
MQGKAIAELNAGLQAFKDSVSNDELAMQRIEIAIVTFGGAVNIVQDFITVDQFIPPILSVNGLTPMGEAIDIALDHLQERKQIYRENGVSYYRPWVFLITDGEPTDEWQNAAQRIQQAEESKKVAFFTVGVQQANMHTLKQISGGYRQPIHLKGLNFKQMFVWLSASLSGVSHSIPGEVMALPAPTGWGEV